MSCWIAVDEGWLAGPGTRTGREDRSSQDMSRGGRLWRRHWYDREVSQWVKRLKVKGVDIALNGTPISELWSVICRMGSHSVTCHPTQVNAPRLNSASIGWYSIYLPQKDGRLSWSRRLITYRDGLPALFNPAGVENFVDRTQCATFTLRHQRCEFFV